jgi:hypothetical protein
MFTSSNATSLDRRPRSMRVQLEHPDRQYTVTCSAASNVWTLVPPIAAVSRWVVPMSTPLDSATAGSGGYRGERPGLQHARQNKSDAEAEDQVSQEERQVGNKGHHGVRGG